jgi:cell division protein FtsQ
MKRILYILIWAGLVCYLFIALGFISEKRSDTRCSEIRVIVSDSAEIQFFNRRDVERVLRTKFSRIRGIPISELNTRKIESLFKGNPYIRKIEVYTTLDGVLTIRVKQRIPVVRVLAANGAGYYLDKDGYIMPASRRFASYVLLANGNFDVGDQFRRAVCLDSIKDKNFYRPWFEVLELAEFINSNDFWRSQVVQLYLNKNKDFEIIPRVGPHQIILGKSEGFRTKFSNLEILYKEGLKKEGWNNYRKIDLRFKNQVICTKYNK